MQDKATNAALRRVEPIEVNRQYANTQFRFIDLFAGIGGFRLGLERAGYRCVWSCENDKWARESYRVFYSRYPDAGDVREVDPATIPDFDILAAGWPCQDNTILTTVVGPIRTGLHGERGSLFYEICRIAAVKQPRYLLLENVPGLRSVGGRTHFAWVLESLARLGYVCEWQCCNSRYFVPQNRSRLFIIGHHGSRPVRPIFPILEIANSAVRGADGAEEEAAVRCLLARSGGPSIDETFACEPTCGIRRLTPRELFALQGFPPEWADKAIEAGIPLTELRKQIGNAVTPQIVYEIATKLWWED